LGRRTRQRRLAKTSTELDASEFVLALGSVDADMVNIQWRLGSNNEGNLVQF
jgi:hypothetical protein